MSISSWFKFKLIIFIIYILLSLIFEQFYRKPLFIISLNLQKQLYPKFSESSIKIFKLLSKFGTQNALIPLLIIILILFPLNISYTFCSIIILSSYFDNILKILYGSPRPFWIYPSIKRTCDGGYGNPSGHSFSSFSVYLSLYNIIVDLSYFNMRSYLKLFLLFLFILFSFLICLSRIFLSIHSLNQIMFGIILGIGMYFYYFHIIELHKFSGKQFFKYINGTFENIIHTIKFIIYFIILLLLYLFRENNWKEYYDIINKECSHLYEYRKFNNDGFFIGSVLFLLIGAHYGLYFLFKKSQIQRAFKEEEINKWSENNKKTNLLSIILLFFPHTIPMIIYLLIPNNSPLYILFPIKVIIPYIITGFSFFGLFIDNCIKLKLANQNIYFNYRIGPEIGDSTSEGRIVEIKIKESNDN
jgi:membrane-associated phospholipid phosphatase